jgi:hypothetical protein
MSETPEADAKTAELHGAGWPSTGTLLTAAKRRAAGALAHDRGACRWCLNARPVSAGGLGWWGTTKLTHCRDCGNTWRRTSRVVECKGCHTLFGGHTTADLHVRAGICVHPADVGLVAVTNEYGSIVWHVVIDHAVVATTRGEAL